VKKHIAIDMDGVMLDFDGRLNEAIALEFGVKVETPTTWEQPLRASLTPMFRSYGYNDCWAWLRQRSHIWAQSQPIPGALAGVHMLRSHGYNVELLTSKPTWAERGVWTWLSRYRPEFNQVTIVPPGQSKRDFSVASILVDDYIGNVREWLNVGRKAVLFDQPWNQGWLDTLFGARN
jgi:5'(3')-deoxyribonucleotidase